jgi:hypothetical protein
LEKLATGKKIEKFKFSAGYTDEATVKLVIRTEGKSAPFQNEPVTELQKLLVSDPQQLISLF